MLARASQPSSGSWRTQPELAEFASGISYEALPEELRRAVDSAAAETEARQWATIRTRLSENYARMASNGVTISTAVPQDLQAALRRAAQGAIDDWLRQAGPSGAAILAAYRKR